MRTLALILALSACMPDPEKVPRGSKSTLTYDEYLAALRIVFASNGKGKVQRYSDVSGGISISTEVDGLCSNLKSLLITPGGSSEMPDGTYVTCRESGEMIWQLDRR
jgi:hypothetical protein